MCSYVCEHVCVCLFVREEGGGGRGDGKGCAS